MTLTRIAAIALVSIVAATTASQAQPYPSRSVQVIIPFTPGGAVDQHGRILSEQLSKQTGVQFVPVNKPGANGNVAGEFVAKARPDGYTILYNSSSLVQNIYLFKVMPFDPFKDLRPVSLVAKGPQLLVVSAKKYPNVKTAADFVNLVKANPGKLRYGTSGVGNIAQTIAVLALDGLKTSGVHVPYSGGSEIITALLGGEVDFTFQSYTGTRGFIEDGSLTPLAITSLKRDPILPNIPTVAESMVPKFEAYSWHGVALPAQTPDDIANMLNSEIQKALNDPAVKARFAANGSEPSWTTAADYGKYLREEASAMESVARIVGLQPQ